MSLFKAISPGSSRAQEIEFLLLAGWALLFPVKQSYLNFLGFSLLLAALALRRAVTIKNIAVTRFTRFLVLFNALFVFSAFFSPHPLKSILFAGDVLLVSLWFLFFFMEKGDMERYLRLLALLISLSSLVVLVFFVLRGGRGLASQFFKNPILQGIVAALAVLVFLHGLLQKYSHADAALLGLNFAALLASASKAAFLGLALFAAAMILTRRKNWLVYFFSVMLLLALLPNPLRRAVVNSLRHDPYVFDRLDIWSMSARMYRHHPWTGIGPDLFNEAALRFNFAQDKGPSRYGKVPESPHSDYWKVIVENGLPGLILVFLFLFFVIRRLLSPPWFDLSKWLLAFLLVQMFLINYIFNFFFMLVFFLLLHDFYPARQRFVSLHPVFRIVCSSFLVFLAVVLYAFPYFADRCLASASREENIVRRFNLLNRAALFSPLDERAPMARAEILRSFAAGRFDLKAWTYALENARQAQRLDKNSVDAFILEAELFRDMLVGGNRYPALCEEILGPLRRAEKKSPFSPFIKMRQAVVLREFGRNAEARERAQAALVLEPDFAAAIVFCHELDGLPAGDPVLRERLARIRAKAERLKALPGSYLFNLHQLPARSPGQ